MRDEAQGDYSKSSAAFVTMNRVETNFCVLVVGAVAALCLAAALKGVRLLFTDTDQINFWYWGFLGLWCGGSLTQFYYRRWKMNGIVQVSILISLIIWALFGMARIGLDPNG